MHVEKEREIAGRGVRAAFWDPDGESVIICGESGISCFDSRREVQWELPLGSVISSADFAHQEGLLVCITEGDELLAVARSGTLEWSIKGSGGGDVAIRSKGQLVVSASRDGELRFYNRRGKDIRTTALDHVIDYVRFTQDGKGAVLVANSVGSLQCFHPQRGELWRYELGPYLSGVVTGGEKHMILCPAYSDGIYAFDADGESIGLFDFPRGTVRDACMGRFSSTILINNDDKRLLLVDEEGRPVWCYEGITDLDRVFMSLDGSRIACTDGAGTLHVFQCEPSRREDTALFEIPEAFSLPKHKQALWSRAIPDSVGAVRQLAIQNDGRIVAVLDRNGELCLFNSQGKFRMVSDPMLGAIEQVRVSHLGNVWVVRGAKGVAVLDVDMGVSKFTLDGQLRIRLSENGLFMVAFNRHTIYLGDKSGRFDKSKSFRDEIVDVRLAGGERAFYCLFLNGSLARYSVDGQLDWHTEIVADRPNKLACLNRCILIGTGSNELVCLDRKGEELWKSRFKRRITRLESCGTWIQVYEGPLAVSLVDRNGRRAGSGKPVVCYTTDYADRAHALAWRDKALVCESLEGETLWQFSLEGELDQLAVARNGHYLSCVSSNQVHYLCLHDDLPVARSVRFLEL
jgi:WD40 repeat protein